MQNHVETDSSREFHIFACNIDGNPTLGYEQKLNSHATLIRLVMNRCVLLLAELAGLLPASGTITTKQSITYKATDLHAFETFGPQG